MKIGSKSGLGLWLGALMVSGCVGLMQAQVDGAATPPTGATASAGQQPVAGAEAATGQTGQAAAAGQAPSDTPYRIKSNVTEVDLIFTVLDKAGHFVNGLQQQNFGLLDNGRQPVRELQFVQQTNLPLRVGIMLDTSSSIRERFEFEQEAATDFLLQVLHPADRAVLGQGTRLKKLSIDINRDLISFFLGGKLFFFNKMGSLPTFNLTLQ